MRLQMRGVDLDDQNTDEIEDALSEDDMELAGLL